MYLLKSFNPISSIGAGDANLQIAFTSAKRGISQIGGIFIIVGLLMSILVISPYQRSVHVSSQTNLVTGGHLSSINSSISSTQLSIVRQIETTSARLDSFNTVLDPILSDIQTLELRGSVETENGTYVRGNSQKVPLTIQWHVVTSIAAELKLFLLPRGTSDFAKSSTVVTSTEVPPP